MAEHLKPENCYVCGHKPHEDGSHKFWSNADAAAEFAAEDARLTHLPNVEAAYVAQHRPY